MIKLEINREMRAPFKGYRHAYPWNSVAAPANPVSTSVQCHRWRVAYATRKLVEKKFEALRRRTPRGAGQLCCLAEAKIVRVSLGVERCFGDRFLE